MVFHFCSLVNVSSKKNLIFQIHQPYLKKIVEHVESMCVPDATIEVTCQ